MENHHQHAAYLWQFGDVDETGEVSNSGAFLIKSLERPKLTCIPLHQQHQWIWRIHQRMHGRQHAGDKLVNPIRFLNHGHQGRDSALIMIRGPEITKHDTMEILQFIQQVLQIGDRLITKYKYA